MTADIKQLEADLARARDRLLQQEREDPDHMVALAMFRADVRRARQAIHDWATDHPEQNTEARAA